MDLDCSRPLAGALIVDFLIQFSPPPLAGHRRRRRLSAPGEQGGPSECAPRSAPGLEWKFRCGRRE